MSERYRISVITPSFNSGKYLEDAIISVLNQNYPNFEHIVVDGGSTDGTKGILKKYPHLQWVSEPDNGQSDAMNKGFKMSKGDIIVYLNADDYFLPGSFKRIITYFENGAKFVVGTVRVEKEDGKYWINDPKISHDEMLRHWEKNAFSVNPIGYFYLREVQENTPGFNEENHYVMDLEFLLECSLKYKFTKMKESAPLGVFRHYEGTKTMDSSHNLTELYYSSHFAFIDKFLALKSYHYVRKYKKHRRKGLRQRIKWQKMKNSRKTMPGIRDRFQAYKYVITYKLRDFAKSPEKLKIIKNYFKRKFR